MQARFNGQKKLVYDVLFNGVFTGTIQWQYLGQETMDGHTVDTLSLDSNTQILQLLNIESKEKVSLDSQTHLPVKVERNVVFFGKKELIEEMYNQDEGYVKIIRNNSEAKNDLLYQEKPIHNILSLLYFFPKDIPLVKGKEFYFNLPTQKLKIKVVSEKTISINKTKKRVYFLTGSGAKRFNLWLDKRERIPLRLEFIVAVGKISLVKKD
ncbi:MAG: hypothetical protein Q8O30_08185 [Candidatus Omnitrophota bacterium]|nr:hypothetical protein [Candidatus Omnitrophota bacterium]